MKATIKFKEYGKIRQRTIFVDENEPNYIVRELAKLDNRVTKSTYITTIKCGGKEYQWFGVAMDAGIY
jgi:hypothetical protein